MTDLTTIIAKLEAAREWRKVPGWPYEASDTGLLRNKITKKILKPTLSKTGYERVTFQHNKVRKDIRVHRAICEAWHGEIPEGLMVNHIDGVKTNNRPNNLEIVDHAANMRHAVMMGLSTIGLRNGAHTKPEKRRKGSLNGSAKLTEIDVISIRLARANGEKLAELAKKYSVDQSLIGKIARRDAWRHI